MCNVVLRWEQKMCDIDIDSSKAVGEAEEGWHGSIGVPLIASKRRRG